MNKMTQCTLRYNDYVSELENREKYVERFKSVFEYDSKLAFQSPKHEKPLLKVDLDLKEKRVAWHKNLSKDMYIAEALNVLSQLKLKTAQEIVKN